MLKFKQRRTKPMADVRIPIDNKTPFWRRFKAMCALRDISVRELVLVLCQRELERYEAERRKL